MSCTVTNLTAVLASLSLIFGSTGAAVTAKADAQSSPVVSIYKDFSWQALGGREALFGGDITHQSKTVLVKYFKPDLAELLVHDAACQARSGGICNLDFDPLFDSQDPAVTDLEVRSEAKGEVFVDFKKTANDEKTTIEFKVERWAGKWKIADIIYRKKSETSLRKILSSKNP